MVNKVFAGLYFLVAASIIFFFLGSAIYLQAEFRLVQFGTGELIAVGLLWFLSSFFVFMTLTGDCSTLATVGIQKCNTTYFKVAAGALAIATFIAGNALLKYYFEQLEKRKN